MSRVARRWWVLLVVAVASLMAMVDGAVVTVALPVLADDLGMGVVERQWVVTAYALAFGGLLLVGGRLCDLLGRRRMFLAGTIAFAVASAAGGLAEAPWMVFAARAAQGAAAAALAPASLSLIAVTFDDHGERLRAYGVYAALQGSGGALGQLVGGVLTQTVGWRGCLLINVPVAAVVVMSAVPLVGTRMDGVRTRSDLDVLSALLVVAGPVLLALGLEQAARPSADAAPTATLIAAGLAVIALFFARQRWARSPLVPPSLLQDRSRSATLLASLLAGAAMFGTLTYLAYYLQLVLGLGPLRAGLAFLPFSLGIIVSSAMGPPLVRRLGAQRLLVVGLAGAAAGALWLSELDGSVTYLTGVLGPVLVISLCLGLAYLGIPALVVDTAGPTEHGVASALVTVVQQLGGGLGVAGLTALFAGTSRTGPSDGTAYGALFLAAAVVFAVAAAIGGGRSRVTRGDHLLDHRRQ